MDNTNRFILVNWNIFSSHIRYCNQLNVYKYVLRVNIWCIYLCLQCYVCLYCFLGYKRIVRCKYLWNVQYNEHWLIAQMLCMQFIVTRPWCDVKISTPCKLSEIVEFSAIIFPFRLPIWIKCEDDVFTCFLQIPYFLTFHHNW